MSTDLPLINRNINRFLTVQQIDAGRQMVKIETKNVLVGSNIA